MPSFSIKLFLNQKFKLSQFKQLAFLEIFIIQFISTTFSKKQNVVQFSEIYFDSRIYAETVFKPYFWTKMFFLLLDITVNQRSSQPTSKLTTYYIPHQD